MTSWQEWQSQFINQTSNAQTQAQKAADAYQNYWSAQLNAWQKSCEQALANPMDAGSVWMNYAQQSFENRLNLFNKLQAAASKFASAHPATKASSATKKPKAPATKGTVQVRTTKAQAVKTTPKAAAPLKTAPPAAATAKKKPTKKASAKA